ncbi:MAG: ATP synthase F0 subunit B [Proteobacteria bacterium]|nr:ATP synthase F0 subunit B [Pseudomonadota bacterium]MBU4383484.1 ATP synthase F0 subunit B [Pseudomonadota bacterium]MBU4604938.1 ATP synthase F0 subunit B [Pseudomonadota bacterium]MCG2765811.1 ATP synthase F0 subunit B [Desulfarculaceae bacterium]
MISINATLFVQIINLLVLIFILNKMMYKPIGKMIAERTATLKGGMAEAASLRERAADTKADYSHQLGQGRQKVRDRLEEVRRKTESEARQVIDEAQAKARGQAEEMVASIQKEMDQARTEIRAQAERVAKEMAGRILGREVA